MNFKKQKQRKHKHAEKCGWCHSKYFNDAKKLEGLIEWEEELEEE